MTLSTTPIVAQAGLFPNGILPYLIGGIFVGLGIAVIYLGTGIIPGNSTFLETTLSYVSKLPRFNQSKYVTSRDWRVVFAVSIVLGAVVYRFAFNPSGFVTDVPAEYLFGGGVLVGIGTRVGKGCTAGHGVCGIGSVSKTSIVNVALFVGVAIVTALVMSALGVTPV
jgi:uncharacterized membrane protein YedE/YeeE